MDTCMCNTCASSSMKCEDVLNDLIRLLGFNGCDIDVHCVCLLC